MATSTMEVYVTPGQTLFAELYDASADRYTILQTVTLTEYGTNLGAYYGSVVDLATGTYTVRVRNAAGTTFSNGELLEHTDETGIEGVKTNASATVSVGSIVNVDTETTIITSD